MLNRRRTSPKLRQRSATSRSPPSDVWGAEAIRLLAQQDFGRVIELLGPVPPEYRSAEASQLLKQAQDLAAEAEQLNERMKQAIHDGQYDGLRENVLERLLELEPGNLTARDIYERLGTYGPDDQLRLDKNGMLPPAHGKYWWLDRLAQLMYQRMTRRRVQRAKSGARRKGEPVLAEKSGPDMPFAAPAIGLGRWHSAKVTSRSDMDFAALRIFCPSVRAGIRTRGHLCIVWGRFLRLARR